MSNESSFLPPLPPIPTDTKNADTSLAKKVTGNGPFGLEMGIKREDFEGSLEELRPYWFKTPAVPKMHSSFEDYVLQITPVQGLSFIKAIGKTISTNPYGIELRSAFENLRGKLENIYGVSEKKDYLMYDSIWNEPRDWMHSILSKERGLSAKWERTKGRNLQNDLELIYLFVAAWSTSEGYIGLEYVFTNKTASDQEIALLEDDAL
jgi:hypothetical protein